MVVPVGFADRRLDLVREGGERLGVMDELVKGECRFFIFSSCLDCFLVLGCTDWVLDDAEAYHGAPVAVQIIGRRLTEERVMAIAEEIGRLLGNEVTP